MTNFTKTVKLSLREPNREKREKIEEAMRQSLECANFASTRMPSLEMKDIKRRSGVVYDIVKELRSNGVSLSASCAYQAVEKARESYLSKISNRNYDTVPKFRNEFVRLHNRGNIGGFFEDAGTYYVELRLFPREKIILPFAPGDYQDYFLNQIVNEGLDHGSGEIKKYNHGYSLNLTIKKENEIDYEPEAFIGVDIGLNVLAWAVAQGSEGDFLGEIHFNGGEAGSIRDKYWKFRKDLQSRGNLKMVKKLRNREQRWMENKNHVVSRRIIEFAQKFENPLILLENINVRELRRRVDNPIIHSWTAGKLRDFIVYKAEEAGIKTKLVNPRNTSRICPECEHVTKANRQGLDFKCLKCGYSNHADFVGARNIALA